MFYDRASHPLKDVSELKAVFGYGLKTFRMTDDSPTDRTILGCECYGAIKPTIRRIFEARLAGRAFPWMESESVANHAYSQYEQVHS